VALYSMISAYYWPCFHLSPISLEAPGCKALFSFLVSACALSIYCGHGSSNSPDRSSSPIYGLPCSMCAVLLFFQASVYVSSGGRAREDDMGGVPYASSNRRLHV